MYHYDEAVNDNKLNSAKTVKSKAHHFKQLLRPVLALLKKSATANRNTYKNAVQPSYFKDETESDQNASNEMLEDRIFAEIDSCPDLAAVPVYTEGHLDIVPIFRGERYIPVHFARTQAGTFFWTKMVGPDCDFSSAGDRNAISSFQDPEIQAPADRWAQA